MRGGLLITFMVIRVLSIWGLLMDFNKTVCGVRRAVCGMWHAAFIGEDIDKIGVSLQ
jgi:hypothetical protein